MNSLLLCIDSKDRAGGTNSNFIYNLNRLQILEPQEITITKILIPNSFYTIQDQSFVINYDGTPYTINITARSDSAPALATYIQNEINNIVLPPGILITYDFSRNRFNFSATLPHIFNFDFSSFAGQTANYNVGIQLGMIKYDNPSYTIAPSNSFESLYQANLSATKMLFLRCPELQLFNNSYFQALPDSILASIPINVNSFGYIESLEYIPVEYRGDKQTISHLTFQIVDDYGNVIILDDNTSSYIEILIKTSRQI